jgi:hypothetical protein
MVICLQIPIQFWIDERVACQPLNVHGIIIRQTEIHKPKSLAIEASSSQVETATENLKRYKSPGFDQILVKPVQAGGKTCYGLHRLTNSVWNKKELQKQWKESDIVPIYKKSDKMMSSYQGISLLWTRYKTL